MRRVLSILVCLLACAPAAHAALPVPPGTPWPEMRHDDRNTGASDIAGVYQRGLEPWSYRTGKGIFSTATIGPGDRAYVGSGDGVFHAFGANGKRLWSFKAGLIDSSAVLWRGGITVGTGDEYLYTLRTSAKKMSQAGRTIWKLKATQPANGGQLVNWWEGNAEIGPDGTIYAGNTGAAAYAITPDGKVKWIFRGGNSFWTSTSIGKDSTSYWGSVDRSIYAIDKNGKQVWSTPTLGFIISSPALSADGSTIYIGSFDGQLHALDTKTGVPKWSFQTGDHVYSSPALEEDTSGAVKALYIGSADGIVYKVDPNGKEVWQYDTGDAVRSSPVLGMAPDGKSRIVYVGSSNGTLFALDADTGKRRWSFDGTPREAALRDRNDMNASPALGRKGVYIGSESGYFWFVPYDWCLHARDARCNTDPGQEFAADLNRVFPVTAGGSTQVNGFQSALPAATTVVGRLVVDQGGKTQDAQMQPLPSANSLVSADPPFPFTAALSGDGHFVFVRPDAILDPGRDYTLKLNGVYTDGGFHIGAPALGATGGGQFSDTIRFHTQPSQGPLPLRPRPGAVPSFRLRRLAVPLPSFLPSVNQIGFDSYEWLVGVLSAGDGKLLTWVVGIKPGKRPRHGPQPWVADPSEGFAFPLYGTYKDDAFELGLKNMTLTFSFGPVPLDLLEFRGRLNKDMTTSGPNLYAESTCAKIPNYGPFLPTTTRLCNQDGKIIVGGTYLTQRYVGSANAKPKGLAVSSLDLTRPTSTADGKAVATLSKPTAAASILLTDASTLEPVPLDYAADTKVSGNQVTLTIPAGTSLPATVRAWAIAGVYPLQTKDF
jgi:outer membrane protein assembly factor BamB